jgi:5-oxoprolinase (ATP-hydrolysing) subunit C
VIEILQGSPLTTVQDLGRTQFRAIGVGMSGAMDSLALRTGNILLGNPEEAAGIEITASAVHLRIHVATAIATVGAPWEVTLAGRRLPPLWVAEAEAGDELMIRPGPTGLRAYLCVAGGIQVPSVMGSLSTDVKSGFGGIGGRGLQSGDRLETGSARIRLPKGGIGVAPFEAPNSDPIHLGVIPAAEESLLTEAARTAFWDTDWRVTRECNRMGLRLEGPVLALNRPVELLSHPILPGVIQLPHGGQPIIQAAEANTCGGYPKIGTIVTADLWRLAQAGPGQLLRFEKITLDEAYTRTRRIEGYLADLRLAVEGAV